MAENQDEWVIVATFENAMAADGDQGTDPRACLALNAPSSPVG